jgi:hypothetical protein
MKGKKKYILLAIVMIGLLWMFSDAFFQPGINDLKGGFKEIVFLRNEQNTGPVVRLYVVSVKDTLWQEMETYGNYMPYNKYGTTKVYFFKEGSVIPGKLSLEGDNFPAEYKPYCLSLYIKNGMSRVNLIKHPFVNEIDVPEKKELSY